MNSITRWALKHSIDYAALSELSDILRSDTGANSSPTQGEFQSEASVTQDVKLAATANGMRLFRNNVGACETAEGRQIRYGLANESSRINKHIKSGDLIGWMPVRIQAKHVGQMVGVFTTIEVKKSNWKYTGKGREVAQKKWIDIARSAGCIGAIINNADEINEICSDYR